jgi:patatin-like phospholipase/acyl hydrolase
MGTPLRLLSIGTRFSQSSIEDLLMDIIIDGGGVKGLASLLILQRIFRVLQEKTGTSPKPCEYFDLIGGTSTGG